MASLHKIRGGKYKIRWREDGKSRSMICNSRRMAICEHDRIQLREATATPVKSGSVIPLASVISKWEAAKIAAGRDPRHMERAGRRLRYAVKKAGWKRTDEITALAAQDWRAKASPRTAAMLKGVLRWAFTVLDQPIHERALALLSSGGRKRAPKRQLLTDAVVDRILALALEWSPSTHAAMHCLATYAWRPITAARALVGDVDLVSSRITLRVKGGDVINHPLAPATLALLRPLLAFRKPTDPLFLDPRTDRAWDLVSGLPQWFKRNIKPELKPDTAGIYDLKRWAITSMLARGMRREEVVVFSGHRVLAQIDTYVVGNDQTQLAALEKLIAVRTQQDTKATIEPNTGGLQFPEKSVKTV